MTIAELIAFLQSNPGITATLLSLAVALVGCYFGMIEYYCKKAYYDYYFIPDFARVGFRMRFNPDYALYGLGAVSFAVLVWFSVPFDGVWRLVALTVSGGIAAGLVAGALFYAFLRGLNDIAPGWSIDDLEKGSVRFGARATFAWIGCVVLYAAIWAFLDVVNFPELPALALCIVACGIAIPLFVYYWAKATIPLWHKTMLVANIRDGDTAAGFEGDAVLATNGDLHYCVSVRVMDQGAEVKIACSDVTTIPVSSNLRMKSVPFGAAEVKGAPTPLPKLGRPGAE